MSSKVSNDTGLSSELRVFLDARSEHAMNTSATSGNFSAELEQRYRATAMKLNVMILLTAAVTGIGVVGHEVMHRPGHESNLGFVSIVIVMLAIGAIVLRRTRFRAMRLQDVAALRGITGLLKSLQNTTLEIGYAALAIALLGFVGTILSGNYEVLRTGVIAIVLFIYCYPKKRAWERVVNGIQTAGDANDSTARGAKA